MRLTQRFQRLVAVALLAEVGSLAAHAATIIEVGGSDFVAFDTDPALLRGSPQAGANWLDSRIYHLPQCEYHTRAVDVNRALAVMRNSGQKKLALSVWHARFERPGECQGFLANSAGGHLAPKVVDNLEQIVRQAGALGYDEIQLRFNPMARNAVQSWGTEWDQAMFDENWGVVQSTVSTLSALGGPRLVYQGFRIKRRAYG